MITRRLLTVGVPLGLLAIPFRARSQSAVTRDVPEPPLPYEELPVPIADQSGRVAFFYSYSCPFCRTYYPTMNEWAHSVPRTVRFLYTPLSMQGALGHYAARKVGLTKLADYEVALFDTMANGGRETDVATYIRTAVRAGINERDYRSAATSKDATEFAARCAQRASAYRIQRTPTVGVWGRFKVTPDHANQDRDQFVALINGLTSQMLGI